MFTLQNKAARHVRRLRTNLLTYSQYVLFSGSNSERFNFANIQMLSSKLYQQIFNQTNESKTSHQEKEMFLKIRKHLKEHELWQKKSAVDDNIELDVPKLRSQNLMEHFKSIASQQTKTCFNFAETMANSLHTFPVMPKAWKFQPGWTKYYSNGNVEVIKALEEDVFVFDVEICLSFGQLPIIATAMSKTAWYCWVSDYLFNEKASAPVDLTPDCMIPISGNTGKQLLIGHHIAFDRAFVKDEYSIQKSGIEFLDTLSIHVCVSGVTNEQRNYMNSKDPAVIYDWMEHGSTNSLANVYQFYCGKQLKKSTRDIFVNGTINDVRENFQECVSYCASDVQATQEVFQMVWPLFLKHAPHPVTFSGMLEMGTAYLPINKSWKDYIYNSEALYNKISAEMKQSLIHAAGNALQLMINNKYKDDPWLWNLDWSLHKTVEKVWNNETYVSATNVIQYIEEIISNLSEKRRQTILLAGYPKWYRDLCESSKKSPSTIPSKISSQTRVTPSLLRMTWDGYPLHYDSKYGWGYLVPTTNQINDIERSSTEFPYNEFMKVVQKRGDSKEQNLPKNIDLVEAMYQDETIMNAKDVGIPGIVFYQLPHKNGDDFNVGNPLAKDFLEKIEDGTLVSNGSYDAKQPIEMNKMLAFWRNGRKRISSQLAVWLNDGNDVSQSGVILPQVISAGTVTRRAVEPTWLTASNPRPDRIGSELKSLVRAPAGFCLVGADVDSQELWIASLFGDSQFSKIHGSTALSWMTLQGNKSDGTDLHSRTAKTIGTNRDQAKIFNYGRVYGAGQKFAFRLLRQFNHQLSEKEAEEKAAELYKSTKGVKKFKLTDRGELLWNEMNCQQSDGYIAFEDLKKLLNAYQLSWDQRQDIVEYSMLWHGGSESEMFNMLESIALSDEPRTPVLECMITNALLPKHVHKHYKTSRVNWVVQSSAVDYLHLLLTSMKWLIKEYNIEARFCISIHDEVRYIVKETDKYRAALALQISNLLTRSLFSSKLGMNDLPQSVAFFSSVDIDKVLRKEVYMDCVTPSNADGLLKGHNIPPGESLDIHELLRKTCGGKISAD